MDSIVRSYGDYSGEIREVKAQVDYNVHTCSANDAWKACAWCSKTHSPKHFVAWKTHFSKHFNLTLMRSDEALAAARQSLQNTSVQFEEGYRCSSSASGCDSKLSRTSTSTMRGRLTHETVKLAPTSVLRRSHTTGTKSVVRDGSRCAHRLFR